MSLNYSRLTWKIKLWLLNKSTMMESSISFGFPKILIQLLHLLRSSEQFARNVIGKSGKTAWQIQEEHHSNESTKSKVKFIRTSTLPITYVLVTMALLRKKTYHKIAEENAKKYYTVALPGYRCGWTRTEHIISSRLNTSKSMKIIFLFHMMSQCFSQMHR